VVVVVLCNVFTPSGSEDDTQYNSADSSAVGLYCVTVIWFTSSYDRRHFATCYCLLLNAGILADNASRQ